MKYWHEKYPFRFGLVFMLVWGALDVLDARWFYPKKIREAKQCELDLKCSNWIIQKNDLLRLLNKDKKGLQQKRIEERSDPRIEPLQ